MQRLLTLSLISTMICVAEAKEPTVAITLDPSCVRNIGGITEFNRDQFITVHEGFGSSDLSDDDARFLENDLEASYGRDGGFISWIAKYTGADPNNSDKPNDKEIIAQVKDKKSRLSEYRLNPDQTKNVVMTTHPELMHAKKDNKYRPWGPRDYQTAAEFTEKTLKAFSPDGKGMPMYVEVLNEPFVHAKKIGTTVEALSEQHNVVAKHLHKTLPDVKVGGYTAAWVEVEARNFEHWENNQKKFMDIAGENMDFWSYHIYDGVNVKGSPRNRTGSNSEAIMDLVDTYSFIKFGVAKPIMISEYGKIPGGNMICMPYSAKRSAGMIRSANGQLMTFMDHPDRLLKVIPFFVGKATWTYDMTKDPKPGEANPFLLWRRTADGYFVETDLTKYYKFWKGVNGEWRKAKSSNPDVRVHMLADDNVLNIIMMNIDDKPQNVELKDLPKFDTQKYVVRTLKTDGDTPVFGDKFVDELQTKYTLAPGQSTMLRVFLKEQIKPTSVTKETRCYATEHLKEIKANTPVTYTFNNVPTGEGTAVLRISTGRYTSKKILPESVEFNGKKLAIPTNWAGDQGGRDMFFGAINFDVPMDIVKTTNEIKITYPDAGGKVACAVLQVNKDEKIEKQNWFQKLF